MSFFFDQMFGGHEGFFQHGGGGHGHDDSDDGGPVDTTKFYEIIGVDKKASQDEIKKAYRIKARKLHPDRHPNEKEKYQEMFQELQNAFEVLSDTHKRELYDKYGEKGVKKGGAPHAQGMSDIFDIFHGKHRHESGPKKSPSISQKLNVTLSDLYNGSTKTVNVKRYAATGNTKACPECNGDGQIIVRRRMGNMVIQQQAQCDRCGGMGYKLPTRMSQIDVHIPAGARHGETLTIPGVGHQYPDHEQGDLVVKFVCKQHDVFKRQGADLGMTHQLSLREALCGYTLRVQHVSGKNLVIRSEVKDEIVQPGALVRVLNMGMPQRYSPHTKGHLYIVMEVKMPRSKELSANMLLQLRKILPTQKIKQDWQPQEGQTEPDAHPDPHPHKEGETKQELEHEHEHEHEDDHEHKQPAKKPSPKGKNKKAKKKTDFAANLKKQMSKKQQKAARQHHRHHQEDDDSESEEVLYTERVDGNPKATPAAAAGAHQEDEEEREGVQCRQM